MSGPYYDINPRQWRFVEEYLMSRKSFFKLIIVAVTAAVVVTLVAAEVVYGVW